MAYRYSYIHTRVSCCTWWEVACERRIGFGLASFAAIAARLLSRELLMAQSIFGPIQQSLSLSIDISFLFFYSRNCFA